MVTVASLGRDRAPRISQARQFLAADSGPLTGPWVYVSLGPKLKIIIMIIRGFMAVAEPMPRERMMWITDYWEAQDILRSASFAADLHNRHSYPIVGESILTLERDAHLQRRRTELPLFSRPALERYEFEAEQELVEAFYGRAQSRRDVLVAAWRGGTLEEELPLDLITVLQKAYSDWYDNKLLRECLFYLAASSSTTTNAAPHVYMGLWRWIGDHPEDGALLGDASFVQLAVAEALRIHPTVPALLRKALNDVTLTSGRSITSGQQIAIDLNRVNGDPAVFGETASGFDPRRLAPAKVPRYATAFAAGAHTCIGRRMAAGSGTGVIDNASEPVGVLTRLMLELFRYDVTLDPARPPVLRTDTVAER